MPHWDNLKRQLGIQDFWEVLLHECMAIFACKQIGLDMNFSNAEKSIEAVILDAEFTNGKCMQAWNSEKQKKKSSMSEGMNGPADPVLTESS